MAFRRALALQDNTPAETVTAVRVLCRGRRSNGRPMGSIARCLLRTGTADAQPPEATVQYSDWTGAPPGTGDRDATAAAEGTAPHRSTTWSAACYAARSVRATVAPEPRLIEMDLTRQAAGFGMETSESGMVALRTSWRSGVAGVDKYSSDA